jgi:hypothetical protein
MISYTKDLKKELSVLDSCEERIDLLKDKYKGKTAVILLTGPTLNTHDEERMREIFRSRDDLVIMPVKQSYNKTLETSDFHVMNHWNIDRKNPFNYKNLENTIVFWNCTASFLEEHIKIIEDNNHPCDIWIPVLNHPYITREQSIQATCNFELFRMLGKEYQSIWGTSILYSTAIPLVLQLGCTKIVFVAWDLKIKNKGHSYEEKGKIVPVDLTEEEEAMRSSYKLYDWCKENGISLNILSDVSPIDERIKRLDSIEEI